MRPSGLENSYYLMGTRERITSPYTVYCGNNTCAYLQSDYAKLVELCTQNVYNSIQGVERRLQLGDCCNPFGQCPNHPVGTHGPGTKRAFDMNYYLSIPGASQYRSGVGNDPASQYVDIYQGGGLNTSKLNWQANFLFWSTLRKIFPGFRVIVYAPIASYIKSKVTPQQASDMFYYVSEDDSTTYLHHTHAHIDLGPTIDWTTEI